MKALFVSEYTSVDALKVEDVPSPVLAADHVRVAVKAAGVGFVEALKIGGRYQTRDPLPFIPGTEFAGIVTEAGSEVPTRWIGKRVFGVALRGAMAEEICVSMHQLSEIPERISFVEAAAVPVNYLTAAYGLLELADLRAGQTLLVLGAAGGTGTAAIKFGNMVGARVIAAASTEEKRAFAMEQGADQVIDYTASDWRKTLAAQNDGKSVDVIFDAIGGDISPIAFRTLGWRGRHLVIGFAAGGIPALPFNIALLKGASLIGVDSAQILRHEPETYIRLTKDIAAWLDAGRLNPPSIQVFPFEKFAQAFDAISDRRAMGKVVVEL